MQRIESGILECSGNRVVPNGSPERRDANHVADASSEPPVNLEGHKGATMLEKDLSGWIGRGEWVSNQARLNSLASQPEQKLSRLKIDRVPWLVGIHLSQDGIVTT